ncbi:signal peptidase I [Sinimarinibacterium sp. NLF-5-8]|uniref:signal peptidase I n=1 Tax=Sinimarinibacterium sp. NLF-5-8 TaxID=2698684 RepID=UPI00137C0E1F|nr:signal peptidase I [Sinimarinibacterium sp. NLF-5-8]QHS09829.1 signal peptidase I [Sinimarinibacterium sp. NLF-5-8]
MEDFHVDFAVVLSVLTLITGVFWALDKWLLSARRGVDDKPGAFVDFCRSFFPVIFVVLFVRSFLVEPFRIPSGSMIPTLLVGDFILVNKFAYGVRDPVFHQKFIKTQAPQRGDVAVFRWPVDPSKDFIKRIVGLPGDHIVYRDKQLWVNGESADLKDAGAFATSGGGVVYRLAENLTGVEHNILINPDRPTLDFEFTVPPGEYFAMGDNRDGSDDSRRWGTVPEKNLVGKAFFIWMSWDADQNRVVLSRVGQAIR